MADKTSIMNKLAWRAKWRKRIQKWKSFLFISVVLLILVPSALIFTPWFPHKIFEAIDNNKADPITGVLKPSAVRDMYRLGLFYGITMRANPEGNDCFLEIIRWQRGINLRKAWMNEPQEPIEPYVFPEEVDEYVGFALIEYARYCRLHQHEYMATELYKLYLQDYANVEGADPKHAAEAELYIK
ncbi:MAG: hypothetical protein JXR97_07540 [Planctomycetes bacterium]|nr:hypothetical protein [Planctomycetota bacterium]